MSVIVSDAVSMLQLGAIQGGGQGIAINGDTTNTDPVVTNVDNMAGVKVGMRVFGPGIPAGATILSLTATTLTLSAAATATAANVDLGVIQFPAGALFDMEVHLIKSDLAPEPKTLAELEAEEADFSGYAAKTDVDMLGPVITDEGVIELVSENIVFIHSAGATENTVYGYYCTNQGNTALLFWEKFPEPQEMASLGQVVSFVMRYSQEKPASEVQPTE